MSASAVTVARADVRTQAGPPPTRPDGASVTVRVDGYTDSVGDDASNLALSRQRAQAVADALTGLVAGTQVTFVVDGHGESDPIAANTTDSGSDNPEGRALNRRVTLSFTR
jgi:outer membrane protein OmpA-like peptidoglycan-associated protein